jgi:amidohydrolase
VRGASGGRSAPAERRRAERERRCVGVGHDPYGPIPYPCRVTATPAPAAVGADLVRWRRRLHAHPELSYQEHETARFVEETLRSFGRGMGIERPTPTSVVARLRAGVGPTLALRADIDALPIEEEAAVEFRSTRPGVMHACGHDAHTAILLGVARTLLERRDELAGEVRFVFQHAEEVPPGGASELVAAGVLDGVDAIVGAHVFSREASGTVAVPVGPFMAAPDTFEIVVRGRGGHAAMVHEAVDPVVAAAQIVTNVQQIVSREVNPIDRAVVSVTRIAGGAASNIVPEQVVLGGTVRTFRPEVQNQIRDALARIATGVAGAHRCTAELHYELGYAATVNDAGVAAVVARNVEAGRLIEIEPVMGGEDFSAYQQVVPGCFFIVGAGGKDAVPHHHPLFTIDEDALPVAHDVFVRTALDFLRA